MGPLEVMLFAGLAIPPGWADGFTHSRASKFECAKLIEITGLCAWGDEVHRKDRPEREEARGLENENSMRVVDQTGILESPQRKGVQRANEGSPTRWS
jgi:hypothetical protein